MILVESAGITDVGRKRRGNEDSFFLSDEMLLYIVADGMGGHNAGEVASRIVVETLRNHMKKYDGKKPGEKKPDFDDGLSIKANFLLSGIHLANKTIYNQAQENPAQQGMGSTLAAICLDNNMLITANVGDSPIYLIRNSEIKEIYVPHTVMAEHAAMAPEGAKPLAKRFQHMLTRGMGVQEIVEPSISEFPVLKNDIFVLCSDGLSDNVPPEEICQMAIKEPPDAACRSFVNLSNRRRGHDNITVIVLKILDTDYESVADEPEKSKKTATEKPKITVEYDTEDDSYISSVDNISVEGVFIETSGSFFEGQEILLAFTIDDGKYSFMVNGKVSDRTPNGIHVKFEDLSGDDRNLIESL